jgi:hypothetical protein
MLCVTLCSETYQNTERLLKNPFDFQLRKLFADRHKNYFFTKNKPAVKELNTCVRLSDSNMKLEHRITCFSALFLEQLHFDVFFFHI